MTGNFSKDKKVKRLLRMHPLMLHNKNEVDILTFRRLLERALKYGFWNGSMAKVS